MVIPPVIFYFIGLLLVGGGAWRARFGLKQRAARAREPVAEPDPSAPVPQARERASNRHLMMGVVWVIMGLVLLVSTVVQTPRFRRARVETQTGAHEDGVLIRSLPTYKP